MDMFYAVVHVIPEPVHHDVIHVTVVINRFAIHDSVSHFDSVEQFKE